MEYIDGRKWTSLDALISSLADMGYVTVRHNPAYLIVAESWNLGHQFCLVIASGNDGIFVSSISERQPKVDLWLVKAIDNRNEQRIAEWMENKREKVG